MQCTLTQNTRKHPLLAISFRSLSNGNLLLREQVGSREGVLPVETLGSGRIGRGSVGSHGGGFLGALPELAGSLSLDWLKHDV